MAEEEDSLEALLNRSTNPLNRIDDWEAIHAYANKVNDGSDTQQNALRLIAHKMQSPQEREALQALLVLEHCARACDRRFHNEIGKFRFLNEMIKLVSPKYLGNRTPYRVKRRVIEILYKWTHELRYETKIGEAYQMLKQQGVITEDPHYLDEVAKSSPPPRPKNPVFDDEEKSKLLQKLLQSKSPEDLQAANRLIKTMVKEDEKRMEKVSRRMTELETVNNNVKVLAEMLDNYKPGISSAEDVELMKELFQTCERLRPNLFRLASEMDEKDEAIGEIFKTNDELSKVMSEYKKYFKDWVGSENFKNDSDGHLSLLDLGTPVNNTAVKAEHKTDLSLLDDQLLVLGLNESAPIQQPKPISQKKDLQELNEIFSTSLSTATTTPLLPLSNSASAASANNNGLLNSALQSSVPMATPLKPLHSEAILNKKTTTESNNSNSKSKGLEILDAIGQTLLKQSLPPTFEMGAEFPKTAEKIPLNQMPKKTDSGPNSPSLSRSSLKTDNSLSNTNSPSHDVGSLSNLFVLLKDVKPGTTTPMNLYDKNGLNVVLHFGTNTPRPDVRVMVVTTMNKSSMPISSIQFQAAVPKGMKIKLQPPSGSSLPAYNPILPPAAVTQIMLLANPSEEKVKLKYKIAYTLNDEALTDVGELDGLPDSNEEKDKAT